MNTPSRKSALPNITNWQSIDWQQIERYVEKLQQRIYHAENLGKNRKVRDLQRMLINSQAALLLSIRQVTKINKNKITSKANGYKALTPEKKLSLYTEMSKLKINCHNPKPSHINHTKKNNAKLDPSEIVIIKDMVYQNIVRMALEPQWRDRLDCNFRRDGFLCNVRESIEKIVDTARSYEEQWIFGISFNGCLDNLIIEQLKGFPQIKIVEKWLKLGYAVETPQTGIIYPILVDIAFYGIQKIIETENEKVCVKNKVLCENTMEYTVIRYLNSFTIMCKTKKNAESMQKSLKCIWLESAQNMTKIAHISDGFDFWGFNIRRYKARNRIVVKPSNESIKKCKEKISQMTKKLYGKNVKALIDRLNSFIISTSIRWLPVTSKKVYASIDKHIWMSIYTFLRRLHPKKTWGWIEKSYFKPDKMGQNKNKCLLTDPISNNQLVRIKRYKAE